MIKTTMMMEMEDLGFGLGPSEFPFDDELLNIPPEGEGNLGCVDNDGDLLQKIMEEVDVPKDMESIDEEPSTIDSWQKEDGSMMSFFQQFESPASNNSSIDNDDTQALIEEMEEFLVQHEEKKVDPTATKSTYVQEELTEEDTRRAEQLLDALMNGNIAMNDSGYETANSSRSDLGNISNISEVITEDGQKIVIVITNDIDDTQDGRSFSAVSPAPSTLSQASPAYSQNSPAHSNLAEEEETSDSDWSPSPAVVTKKTRSNKRSLGVNKRGPYKRSLSKGLSAVKDRKERKKLQNVVAARRYRDKKKSEQTTVETEEQTLTEKNAELKEKVADMEGELKTLKKLLVELGLVKV